MSRFVLTENEIDTDALNFMNKFHDHVVREVASKVASERVVVVGMRHNPVVKKATKALTSAGIKFTYLEYGSYFSQWKQRLAIKLWSGWPTYPQIFVEGKLIGGFTDAKKLLDAGKLK